VNQFAAVVADIIIRLETSPAKCRIGIPVIFRSPVPARIAVISMILGAIVAPPFIQVFDVLEVVRIGIFVAVFAVGQMIVAAGFAIDIPVPVNDIIIFVLKEIFLATGTLFQMFVPAVRTKIDSFPVDFELFKLFRRSADVTCDRFHLKSSVVVVVTNRKDFFPSTQKNKG